MDSPLSLDSVYFAPPAPGIPEPPSHEAGLFQGVLVTLCSSFGVPSGFLPPPPEEQEERRMARERARRAGPNFDIDGLINDLITDFNRRGGSPRKHICYRGLGIDGDGFQFSDHFLAAIDDHC